MTTNMNFSFTRLMAVMKRDMMENWKINMYRFIGCYSGTAMALFFAMQGIERSIERNIPRDLYFQFCDRLHTVIIFCIFFYLMICASRIMEVMNTKNKRISYMMLPATIGEKFISRVIYVCITSMVIFFVGLFFAELTRLSLLPLFDAPEEFHRFCLFDIMSVSFYDTIHINPEVYGTSSTFISYLFLISNGLWGHSIYILGGTYFRKHPFIKTWGIMMLLFVIIAYIFGRMVAKELFSYFDPTDVDLWNVNIISIIFLVLTVINWTLSYHLFRNSQITDRKLFT